MLDKDLMNNYEELKKWDEVHNGPDHHWYVAAKEVEKEIKELRKSLDRTAKKHEEDIRRIIDRPRPRQSWWKRLFGMG